MAFYRVLSIKMNKGNKNGRWKGGEIFDGRYWKVKADDHPSVKHLPLKHRYVLKHRLAMEQHLGRYLLQEEQVHHKDENVHNNDITNLEIVSKAKHNQIHKRVKKYLENGGDRNVFRPS